MADRRPVGVFDSGVGGLSALRKIRTLLPNEDLIYFGDTARIPYGTRTDETIITYAREDMKFLLSKGVKAVVIACGTVSSIALEVLEREFDIPVLGVVKPAAKRAAALTRSGKIGVFGTTATINNSAYKRELFKIAPECTITQKACPLLVPLIENGYITSESEITRLALREYLVPIKECGADVLILGCTHYPLIRKLIEEEWGGGITVDTGAEAAAETVVMLHDMGLENDCGGSILMYSSDSAAAFESQAKLFLSSEFCSKAEITGNIGIENYK